LKSGEADSPFPPRVWPNRKGSNTRNPGTDLQKKWQGYVLVRISLKLINGAASFRSPSRQAFRGYRRKASMRLTLFRRHSSRASRERPGRKLSSGHAHNTGTPFNDKFPVLPISCCVRLHAHGRSLLPNRKFLWGESTGSSLAGAFPLKRGRETMLPLSLFFGGGHPGHQVINHLPSCRHRDRTKRGAKSTASQG